MITDRLDAWLEARRPIERVVLLVEAAVGLVSVAVLLAVVGRSVAGPGPLARALTELIPLMAAFGYGVAALVGRRLPAEQARWRGLRPGLTDALHEALGKRPRGDLRSIVQEAVGPDRVREAVARRLSADSMAARIEAAMGDVDGLDAADDARSEQIFDEVIAALDEPANRRRLARWLGRMLIEQPDLIDGIARPVTRKLVRESTWGFGDKPFSWRALNKKTRRFLEQDKGRAWADAVIGRALDDLTRRPPRAQAVHRALLPAARDAAGRHLSVSLGEQLSTRLREDGEMTRLIDGAAQDVAEHLQPALLGALGHVTDERASAAAAALGDERLHVLLRRSADGASRVLRVACFIGGGALGALAGLWR